MKDMSITQEYMVCIIYGKGKFPSNNQRAVVCLIVGGLLEMQLEKCVSIHEKTLEVCAELPQNMAYLSPLYHIINEGKPVKIEKVVQTYAISLSNKKLKELTDALMNHLNETDALESARSGIFKTQNTLIPKKEIVTGVVEKLRAELLEDGEISIETAALTALMDQAGILSEYFSKFEQKELKTRLTEIKNSDAGTLVTQIVQSIDEIMAAILCCVIAASC